jgi:hypothetical protein
MGPQQGDAAKRRKFLPSPRLQRGRAAYHAASSAHLHHPQRTCAQASVLAASNANRRIGAGTRYSAYLDLPTNDEGQDK